MLKGVLNKLIGDAGNIIDNVVTTKEEKMKLKNEMKKMLLDSENDLQKNFSENRKEEQNFVDEITKKYGDGKLNLETGTFISSNENK